MSRVCYYELHAGKVYSGEEHIYRGYFVIFQDECAQNKEWYSSVQAELESNDANGAIHQMKSILEHGQCIVGHIDEIQSHNESALAKVMMNMQHSGSEATSRKCYYLDELKDLESKVVLVAGNESHHVARFVDVSEHEMLNTF